MPAGLVPFCDNRLLANQVFLRLGRPPGTKDGLFRGRCQRKTELLPEIRTLTSATICCLLTLDDEEITDVETQAACA